MKIKAIALTVGLALATTASFIPLSTTESNASSARGLFDSYNNSLGSHTVNSRSGRTWNGGQISARWNRPQIDIIDVQAPSVSVGCGGIDIFAGGFGLISGDELTQVARAIAQGSAVYFFKLAANAICSSCAAEMENIASALRRFNELSRNACEMTEQILTNRVSIGEGGTLQQRLQKSKETTAAAGWINDRVDGILNALDNPGNKEHLGGSVNASFPGTALRRANVSVEIFNHLGFSASNEHRLAASVLMTFVGGFSIQATESEEPGKEPGATMKRAIPASLTGFFVAPSKDGNTVTMTKCSSSSEEDLDCLNFTSEDIEYESVLNIVRQHLAGTSSAPHNGIIPRMMSRTPLEAPQLKFLQDFRIPAAQWLRLAEEHHISTDIIIDYLTVQTTMAVFHQVDSAVRSLYAAVQSNMTDSSDLPAFVRESSDAYLAYIENMKAAQAELESQRKTVENQLGKYIQIAQLNQSRLQGR